MADKNDTKPKEAKDVAFKRIAERRVGNALAAIKLIGSLANTNNYEYSEDQVKKILTALESEVVNLQKRFANPNAPEGSSFTL